MWYTYRIEEIIRKIKTNKDYGLSNSEAKSRLSKYRRKYIKRKEERKLVC